jgi:hypothetical protein
MGDESVPRPNPETKEPRPGEPAISQAWLECLSEAIQMRTEQEFQYRLKTGPELKESAYNIGPLAGEFGLESPVFFRAVAALVTQCHPLVLLAALAGVRTTVPPRRHPRCAEDPQ